MHTRERGDHMLLHNETVRKALDEIKALDETTTQETLTLCQIPAPSHQEKEKAEYVLKLFRETGLLDVHMDEVWNVLGRWPGTGGGPTVMLAAHTDTVFPMETDVTVRKEGGRYYCPGINDDTHAVAEIMAVAKAMVKHGLHAKGDIIFCANVCEEGLGDLKGVKHIFGHENAIDAFVSVDNPVTGGVVYTATGSRRYQVTFSGSGGHSFADFGLPNPIHAMGRAIAAISDFQAPRLPKTTFNVGVVSGGTSVNTIAASASLLMDIRSDSDSELERLTQEFLRAVDRAVEAENSRWAPDKPPVKAEVEVKGIRPAGTQPPDCPIVTAAFEAARMLGIQPELRDESSTDANIPISMSIPAITVGRGGREGGVHTTHEWFEPVEAWLGPQRDLLLLLLLAGLEGCVEPVIEKRT